MIPSDSKPIPGTDGIYRADIYGNVWSCSGVGRYPKPGPWRRRKPIMSGHYLRIKLRHDSPTLCIHRLILETFVGPRPKEMECRHLDGTVTNNRLSNLTWGTRKENMEDRVRKGTQKGENNPMSKLTWNTIERIRNSSKSKRELAEEYGIAHSNVCRIVKGTIWVKS